MAIYRSIFAVVNLLILLSTTVQTMSQPLTVELVRQSNSNSPTPTSTRLSSPSSTPTRPASRTPTPTLTNSPSNSPSKSPSKSPTPTPTILSSNTPSKTPSPSRAPSKSPTTSPTLTPTASSSVTLSPTISTSSSASISPTMSSSEYPSSSATYLPSPTHASTASATASSSQTQSSTITATMTPSTSASSTASSSMSATQTPSPSTSESSTPTSSPSEYTVPSSYPWKEIDTSKKLKAVFKNDYKSFNTSKNDEFCNTQVFSVRFDDDIEDYAPIINIKLSAAANFGGSVRLDAGAYYVKSPIYIPSRTCLIGDSSKTTFIKVEDYSSFPSNAKGIVVSLSGEHISIRGVSVELNSSLSKTLDLSGVYIGNVNYALLQNVNSSGHSKYGFEVQGIKYMMATHLLFESCIAESNKLSGFYLSYTAYGSIHNSKSNRNGKAGVFISGGTKATRLSFNDLDNNGLTTPTNEDERINTCGVSVMSENDNTEPEQVKLVENKVVNTSHAGICAKGVESIDDHRTTVTNYDIYEHYCYDFKDVRGFMSHNMNCRFPKAIFYPGDQAAIALKQSTQSIMPTAGPSKPFQLLGNQVGCIGVVTNNVCCPMNCETCTTGKCGSKNENCCADTIKGKSWLNMCSAVAPPCFLEK